MTVRELREKYLRFFESKGHIEHPSGSLIPYDVTGRLDESLLFNGAGMVQFKPYFRGVAKPPEPRLVNCQKCVRTGDIEDVGDLSHHTFFEMLGNFSFGDYFKEQAIAYSWEFLTSPGWLALDPHRLSFTVFEDDDEAYAAWSTHIAAEGIDPATRIFRLGEDTNYWPAGAFSHGPPGPCGPNSEMFYWVTGDPPTGPYSREDWIRDDEAKMWLEIWNDVFIQFEWQGELRNPDRPGEGYVKIGMPPLPFQSIDTGMGLERTAAVLGGFASTYLTDVFAPIIAKIEEVASPPPSDWFVSEGGGMGEGDSARPQAGRISTPQPPSSVSGQAGGPPEAGSRETEEGGYAYGSDDAKDVATRIIADHIRTAVFCIADGVLPGNSGRGYVLRRLIRRAVLKGQRVLGIERPFFHLVFEGVVEGMGDHYRELDERRDVIVETLRNEEALFRSTLKTGLERLIDSLVDAVWGAPEMDALLPKSFLNSNEQFLEFLDGKHREYFQNIAQVSKDWSLAHDSPLVVSGAEVFRLYHTYGFPHEETKELCEEAGVEVDEAGYEEAMLEAQERSRAGTERESVYGGVQVMIQVGGGPPTPTIFRGYDQDRTQSHIVGALIMTPPPSPTPSPSGARSSPQGEGAPESTIHNPQSTLAIALDETPFYAESGGQVGDTGVIRGGGFEGRVKDVVKQNGVFVHEIEPIKLPVKLQGETPEEASKIIQEKLFNLPVEAEIDHDRRARIQRNHTATHLLHAALRQVLGKHVTQAGSYVGPDHLRFDFTHGKAMTPEEIAEVEVIVNRETLRNTPVITHADIAISEAKARGAMALFGEKYGDKVRMVEIGEFSRELCGGTHVRTTGEIGLFKITSESSAASGIRRMEAVTGEGAYHWVLEQTRTVYEAAGRLKSTPKELLNAIERLTEQLKEEKRRREKAEMQVARGAGVSEVETRPEEIKGVFLWRRKFEDVDQKIVASAVDDAVAQNPDLVALAAIVNDGKPMFLCKCGAEAVKKGAHAGNLIREVAKIAGGGGGGRPEFATAGGKDASKVDDALAMAASALDAMV